VGKGQITKKEEGVFSSHLETIHATGKNGPNLSDQRSEEASDYEKGEKGQE